VGGIEVKAARHVLLGLALCGLGAAAVAAEEAAPQADPLLAEMGAEEYTRYCASCHGVSGLGDGPVSPALKRTPSDLTRIAARRGGRFPDAEVARFIDGRFELAAHGSREMPIWGERFADSVPETDLAESVTRGKIAVLIEYLKSIQQPLVAPE
jgi:mono/diheme cytochrome c family protein